MSNADYSSENVSPLMIFFAPIINKEPANLKFKYDDVEELVEYTEVVLVIAEKTPELEKYEKYAKKSARLKNFMENSPADIEYFQNGTYYKEEA